MDALSTTLPGGDVLAGLAAKTVAERDAATRVAIALGPSIAPELLAWEAAPPSHRARRLWAYTGIHLRRAELAIGQPRNFELQHTGSLASALAVLAQRHGVLVAKDLPDETTKPIELALASTTLLGALDEACQQADCRGNQRARGELAAAAGAEPRYPAAYTGPLRVRVIEVRTVRTTDFATTHATMQVRLQVDWEWPISPLTEIAVKLDDSARVFEAMPVGTALHVGTVAEIVVEVEPAPALALAGTVTSTFDGAYEDVRLPVPGAIEAHGLSATASANADGCQLVLEPRDPVRARGLGLSAMVLAIATDGEEGIPQVHRVRAAGGGAGTERWGLRNRAGFGTVGELRLRVATAPIRATFPFTLPAIALP